MAIDLLSESRISPTKLARREGISPSTPWRWLLRGVKGHKLESFLVGGKRYTTLEAYQRFIVALNAGPGERPVARTTKQREAAVARAEKELTDAGA